MKQTRKQLNFEKFVLNYQPRLSNYASRFIINSQERKDAVQNTLIKVWEKYSDKDEDAWPGLAFTILRNSCINYHNRVKPNLPKSIDERNPEEELLYMLDFGVEYDPEADRQIASVIASVMAELPERCRQVFEMSRFQNMKNKEIAKELGISESAIEKHISRALKAFDGLIY